jgi:rsbT co-antagonist protein RsbR
MRAARAAQLLGAQVILVGITPEVAQSIVHLGVDFSRIITRADLQSGVLYAFRQLGLAIGTSPTRANEQPLRTIGLPT